jgi:hypothetical protein
MIICTRAGQLMKNLLMRNFLNLFLKRENIIKILWCECENVRKFIHNKKKNGESKDNKKSSCVHKKNYPRENSNRIYSLAG